MSERKRFAVILTLLLAAIALCTWLSVERIEQDLLARAQVALASSAIPFYGVDVEGRDVILTGFVDSADSASNIRSIVEDLHGVRSVRDLTVVERLAGTPAPDDRTPVTIASSPVRLRVQRLGDQLFISGRVPDDGALDALVRAATARFGAGAVTSSLIAAPGVARPEWLDSPASVIELLALASDNVRLVVEGNRAILSGQVRDQAAADRLRTIAARFPGVHWTFELFSARGPVAGGGGA